jgi:hypothetical protein
MTRKSKKARARNISAREFSKEFTRLVGEHLANLPAAQQDRRISAAQRIVARRLRETRKRLGDREADHVAKRKRMIAKLVPAKGSAPFQWPDFQARLKKLYKSKQLRVAGAELVSRDRD